MEFDAFYTLESQGGQEIGGSRAGMALRDFARFAQLGLDWRARDIPAIGLRQLFVSEPNGTLLELNFRGQ